MKTKSYGERVKTFKNAAVDFQALNGPRGAYVAFRLDGRGNPYVGGKRDALKEALAMNRKRKT